LTERTQLWASGGGVQSAAIAALIVQGKLRPDLAVIVDTEREQSTTRRASTKRKTCTAAKRTTRC
jgi:enterochelin esterase-like enzyme